MQSVLDIKRAVRELQKEVAELKALLKSLQEPKEKPDGEKRPYRRRDPSAD